MTESCSPQNFGLERQHRNRYNLDMVIGKSRAGYIIVFHRTRTGYGAHVPDLPGCVAAARTMEQTKKLLEGGLQHHIRVMRGDGGHVPHPRSLPELRRRHLLPLRQLTG
jgi:predicted RNase H-like HicB family nuclease